MRWTGEGDGWFCICLCYLVCMLLAWLSPNVAFSKEKTRSAGAEEGVMSRQTSNALAHNGHSGPFFFHHCSSAPSTPSSSEYSEIGSVLQRTRYLWQTVPTLSKTNINTRRKTSYLCSCCSSLCASSFVTVGNKCSVFSNLCLALWSPACVVITWNQPQQLNLLWNKTIPLVSGIAVGRVAVRP